LEKFQKKSLKLYPVKKDVLAAMKVLKKYVNRAA